MLGRHNQNQHYVAMPYIGRPLMYECGTQCGFSIRVPCFRTHGWTFKLGEAFSQVGTNKIRGEVVHGLTPLYFPILWAWTLI